MRKEIPEHQLADVLTKFQITRTEYTRDIHDILNLGYHIIQAQSIVLRKSSTNTIRALLKYHSTLKYLGFKDDEIITIAAHDGGSKNLAAVNDNFEALQTLGFTSNQIVSMVALGGGSKNLAAVKDNFDVLQAFGFTSNQIVSMVARHGGSKNLTAVKDNFDVLQAFGFTSKQIVSMVAHHGGSKNLAAVKDNFDALQNLGFTSKQIVSMVAHNGGSKNLNVAIRKTADDIFCCFTVDEYQLHLSKGKTGREHICNTLEARNKLEAAKQLLAVFNSTEHTPVTQVLAPSFFSAQEKRPNQSAQETSDHRITRTKFS